MYNMFVDGVDAYLLRNRENLSTEELFSLKRKTTNLIQFLFFLL